MARWARQAAGEAERRLREERVGLAFGRSGAAWNEELVLERYELLYEAGLVAEAARDLGRRRLTPRLPRGLATGAEMAVDHRRILATAIGRLRGKIKYRPVVFELMPPAFTLLQLQRTVEALAGVRLHKQNFRRLVEQQGLVEETGEISARTGGRPARLVRFRREVLLERPAPGLRLRPPPAAASEHDLTGPRQPRSCHQGIDVGRTESAALASLSRRSPSPGMAKQRRTQRRSRPPRTGGSHRRPIGLEAASSPRRSRRRRQTHADRSGPRPVFGRADHRRFNEADHRYQPDRIASIASAIIAFGVR